MNDSELRELDAWIHRHVFGVKCECVDGFFKPWGQSEYTRLRNIYIAQGGPENWPESEPPMACNHAPKYSTTAAAVDVLKKCVERLENDRAYPAIRQYHDLDGFQGWQVCALYETRNQRTFSAVAETLEATICLFAKQLFTK